MKKLPAKYATIVMPLVLSIMMSGIISFVATVKAMGLPPGLLVLWLQAWGASWLVAFPAVAVVLPIVRRIVGLVVESPKPK